MSQSISLSAQNSYEIKIYGQPNNSWLEWFGESKIHMEVSADENQVTTFSNVVLDQAGLVGLVRRLHARGIVLISIRLLWPSDSP